MFQLDVRSYIHPHRTISDSVQMLTMDDMMAMGRLAAGTFQLLSEHIQHNLRGILTSIKSYATPAYMSQTCALCDAVWEELPNLIRATSQRTCSALTDHFAVRVLHVFSFIPLLVISLHKSSLSPSLPASVFLIASLLLMDCFHAEDSGDSCSTDQTGGHHVGADAHFQPPDSSSSPSS
eukprot:m.409239 g.409239  ORF g.409239 m.409239 type:complete len:179 (-) comp56510_c0_seq93:158-694(-)